MPRYNALPPNLAPRGLNREAAAQYVGVSPGKFDEMVADDRMPKPLRLDGRKLWDRLAIDRAFDALSERTQNANPWDELLVPRSFTPPNESSRRP
jgi:predicted DNA-binding transcriptional regulator AlpA